MMRLNSSSSERLTNVYGGETDSPSPARLKAAHLLLVGVKVPARFPQRIASKFFKERPRENQR